ncbi:hypothetical protein HAX54_003430 [Datura stramonium]|uniref:Uncharacterized protein n=1 Tax=Datura stramonium TaxID=4076 RepID=A0ABS8T6W2_DATST|nr:hypothetical protein [Datura stramonium]
MIINVVRNTTIRGTLLDAPYAFQDYTEIDAVRPSTPFQCRVMQTLGGAEEKERIENLRIDSCLKVVVIENLQFVEQRYGQLQLTEFDDASSRYHISKNICDKDCVTCLITGADLPLSYCSGQTRPVLLFGSDFPILLFGADLPCPIVRGGLAMSYCSGRTALSCCSRRPCPILLFDADCLVLLFEEDCPALL